MAHTVRVARRAPPRPPPNRRRPRCVAPRPAAAPSRVPPASGPFIFRPVESGPPSRLSVNSVGCRRSRRAARGSSAASSSIPRRDRLHRHCPAATPSPRCGTIFAPPAMLCRPRPALVIPDKTLCPCSALRTAGVSAERDTRNWCSSGVCMPGLVGTSSFWSGQSSDMCTIPQRCPHLLVSCFPVIDRQD